MKYLKYFESNDIDITGIIKDILIDLDDLDNIDYTMTPKDDYRVGSIILNINYSGAGKNIYSEEINSITNKLSTIIDRLVKVMDEYGLKVGNWRDVESFSDGGYISTVSEWRDMARWVTHPVRLEKYWSKNYIIYR